jgi:hypothetical protein
MDERLAELLAGAAAEIAAEQGITVEEATQIVHERLPRLRAKYRDAGALYGDDDAGLAKWMVLQALSDPAD